MTLTGVAIGLVAAAMMTRFLSALLYQVTPFDLQTFAVTVAVLAFTAMAACIAPALRAVHVDPVEALRRD